MTIELLPELPCYLNGEFSTLREAKVSVMDRGFIFGDGVYEVVPVYAGRPFRFPQHMVRLDRSLAELRIANPMSHQQWRELTGQLIAAYAGSLGKTADQTDQLVYIQVTRGVALRDHVMPPGIRPTVFATSNRISPPTQSERSDGVACIRAGWCASISRARAVASRCASLSASIGRSFWHRALHWRPEVRGRETCAQHGSGAARI